ncbi:MAG TPA: NAD(P)/FAD-dependent oxidoreductase [Stellaceae bacterium]|nr:NAD(P)/FAD-dependent oxidoreductase [Stellaceae bacterium]
MAPTEYDLVVIGSGVAGSTAAQRCRAAGWRVAIIDQLPFGGTCALRGCDPKKVLVGVAESIDHDRRLRGKGVGGGRPVIDWPALMEFKRGFTAPVPRQREAGFAASGIDAIPGRARFRDRATLEVDGRLLQSRFFLLAAGAAPMRLGIDGEELLADSTDFLDLATLPRRIVLVGGGYIAAEFSHIAARAGAAVTVVERGTRWLTQFDPELAARLAAKTEALGITIRLGTRVEAVTRSGAGFAVHAVAADGGKSVIEADLAVHAAGRAPDFDALDLAAAGVALDGKRLALNRYLQSVSNPAIYAAGDAAAQGPPLTPVATRDGALVAANMLEGNRHEPNYRGIPSVVFTIPVLARVGLLEAEANAQGLRFELRQGDSSGWYTQRRVGEDCAGYKILLEAGTGTILGAHLVGTDAEHVINLFALAIREGLAADRLKDAVFSYPNAASDIGYMI